MALIDPSPTYDKYNSDLATKMTNKVNEQLATLEVDGLNIHYLDVNTLVNRVIADPAKYGYTSVSALNSCQDNDCGNLTLEEQNQYLFIDTIHFTTGFQHLLARYAANLITAGGVSALQTESGLGSVSSTQKNLMSRVNTDLAQNNGKKTQWFITPGYDRNNQSIDDITSNKAKSDITSLSVGGSYKIADGLHIGAVANYTQSETSLSRDFGGNDFDYGQAGAFLAFRDEKLSIDVGVTGTYGSLDLIRTGVMDNLLANPDASAFGVFAQAKYLFDIEGRSIKFGPVASVSYVDMSVDGYTESGDGIITIRTDKQDLDQLTANFGMTITGEDILTKGLGFRLNLTGEYQRTGDHNLTYYQTNAPTRSLSKLIEGDSELYGRISGNLNYTYTEGQSIYISGSTTVGRDEGEQAGIQAGLKINY